MGDKTQILALLLAARLQRPWPILVGMVLAVSANHLLAGGLGVALADRIPQDWMRWLLAGAFVIMAGWLLVPDAIRAPGEAWSERGAFLTSLVAFFLAEMGDKTQFATVALAARYHSVLPVLAGSTVGMVLADAPVIWFGERITRRIPRRTLRQTTAALFAGFGVAILAGW